MATYEVTLTWVWRLCAIRFVRYHQKVYFRSAKIFGILFGKYFELRKSNWASQCTYISFRSQIWRFSTPEILLPLSEICEKLLPNRLILYGFSNSWDRESCKIMIKVVFVISVDDIKHNEACLTTKKWNSKNLLSCLEA